MGKRRHRHRSSDDEKRESELQKRVEWLEEQILRQRGRNYEDKHSDGRHGSRRSSSLSRSRSRSRRRDYHDYDRDRYKSDHDDDGYSEHSAYSSYEREQDRRRKLRSRSRSSEVDSHDSNFRSVEPIDESNSKENAPQVDIQTATEKTKDSGSNPAVTAGSNDKLADGSRPLADVSSEMQEDKLDAEVLEVFGERVKPERVLASAVHSHLATIWCDIIEKGLPAEERKATLKKFPPPKNCVLMDPPKLNLEVKAALDSTIQKRDGRIVEKQEKIAAALAGIGKSIELLLKANPAGKKEILEPLTGAARLLADLQHDETSIRRSLVLKNIKAPFKDTLKDVSSDEWLFGKEITEKIKAAKVLQRSTKDLKTSFKQSSDRGQSSKNSKAPPHQSQYRSKYHSRGGGYRQNFSRSNSYSRGNKSSSRGKSQYQKQEQTNTKKSD